MADCKDCIHERVCEKLCPRGLLPYQSSEYPAELFCLEFKSKSDVAEVKHGHWIEDEVCVYACSECGFIFTTADDISEFKFCRCGADMRGEEK